ncbi:hypothetical protein, partial [Stenotrophomonas maltophilia]|uniref:hypothetical protein n=1 Tax=Stenotrophomonas maltophilia TaxID=40324 RepID=UPI001B7D7972
MQDQNRPPAIAGNHYASDVQVLLLPLLELARARRWEGWKGLDDRDRSPHGCGDRAYRDVFTACPDHPTLSTQFQMPVLFAQKKSPGNHRGNMLRGFC